MISLPVGRRSVARVLVARWFSGPPERARSPLGQDFRDFARHKLVAFGCRVRVLVQLSVPRRVLRSQFG